MAQLSTLGIIHTLMKTKSLTPIILAVFFAISPLSASADSFHDIAIQARAKYAAAQESWQRGLAELVTRTDTNFQEIATIQRDLQLAYIEQSTARFRYLLKHDSQRIILTNGVSKFANFEWSDKDTKALTDSDPKYVQLQKRILELETKNDKEPDWPKIRVWFRDTLSKSGDYKTLLSAFQAQQKAVEDLLGGYKP